MPKPLDHRLTPAFARLGVALAACAVGACGKVEVKEAAGNASLVAASQPKAAVAGEDITVDEVKVWQAAPNNSAPGVANVVDTYTVQVWATLAGESKPRYAEITNLRADPDGNLYVAGNEPGTLRYNDELAGAVGEDLAYTVTGKDALVREEWDYAILSLTTRTGGVNRTARTLIKPSEQDPSFANIRQRVYATSALFSRTRYEKNEFTDGNKRLKGRLGCFNRTTAADGSIAFDAKPTFFDVEIGATLGDKDGVIQNSSDNAADDAYADQILWVRWAESWYVTGINVKTKTLRMVRQRTAPFYLAREMPGRTKATAAGGAPSPSGAEAMMRACSNAVEAASGSKVFFTAGFQPSGTNPGYTGMAGTGASHCAATKTADNTTPLNVSYAATPFAACAAFNAAATGLNIAAGTWNGSYSTGPITSLAGGFSSFAHLEQTPVVDVAF